jgi:anti-sigma regulatory factor (Ser/Thr protein kinase)
MPTMLRLSADARPECVGPLRNVVANLAKENGLSSARVYAVKLCVGEAIANAVMHAYPEGEPGPVEVSAQEVGGEFAVVVADRGSGAALHPSAGSVEGGFGLGFMTRLTDGCTFTATSAGTTVEMLFPLPRQGRGGPWAKSQRRWTRLAV